MYLKEEKQKTKGYGTLKMKRWKQISSKHKGKANCGEDFNI